MLAIQPIVIYGGESGFQISCREIFGLCGSTLLVLLQASYPVAGICIPRNKAPDRPCCEHIATDSIPGCWCSLYLPFSRLPTLTLSLSFLSVLRLIPLPLHRSTTSMREGRPRSIHSAWRDFRTACVLVYALALVYGGWVCLLYVRHYRIPEMGIWHNQDPLGCAAHVVTGLESLTIDSLLEI